MHTDHTTEPEHIFSCAEPVTVDCRWNSGCITVTAADTDTITVEIGSDEPWVQECTVELAEGGRLQVFAPRPADNGGLGAVVGFFKRQVQAADLDIIVPRGSSLEAHASLGDVTVSDGCESVHLEGTVGDISIGDCRQVDLRITAGDINIQHVAGDCTVHATAGDITVQRVDGEARLTNQAGDMTIAELRGPATMQTSAGDQIIETIAAPVKVKVGTAAGDIDLGIATGLKVFSEVSTADGSMDNRLTPRGMPADGEGHVHLSGSSSFGDITVHDA